MHYPSMEEIGQATQSQITLWIRALPAPRTRTEIEVLNAILQRDAPKPKPLNLKSVLNDLYPGNRPAVQYLCH